MNVLNNQKRCLLNSLSNKVNDRHPNHMVWKEKENVEPKREFLTISRFPKIFPSRNCENQISTGIILHKKGRRMWNVRGVYKMMLFPQDDAFLTSICHSCLWREKPCDANRQGAEIGGRGWQAPGRKIIYCVTKGYVFSMLQRLFCARWTKWI